MRSHSIQARHAPDEKGEISYNEKKLNVSYEDFASTVKLRFKLPAWEGKNVKRLFTIILLVCLLGAIGVIIYLVNSPELAKGFTEFYILGPGQKTQDYPAEFIIDSNQVTGVQYRQDGRLVEEEYGRLILGIVNREHKEAEYVVTLRIDGERVMVWHDDEWQESINEINLQNDERWEGEIGFRPAKAGENQKVEFLLYINEEKEEYLVLHLWINVRE